MCAPKVHYYVRHSTLGCQAEKILIMHELTVSECLYSAYLQSKMVYLSFSLTLCVSEKKMIFQRKLKLFNSASTSRVFVPSGWMIQYSSLILPTFFA